MKLNRLEFLLVNNPARGFVQAMHEVRVFRRMSSRRAFDTVLEIGCGNGRGTKLIRKHFAPRRIVAVDLDERMIRLANRKNADPAVEFRVMDASKLDFSDESFDAVFDFGIVHHIPNWRDCIAELARVVKPGGQVFLEDLSSDTFATVSGRAWKALLEHPYDEMFSTGEFVDELQSAGFTIDGFHEFYPLRLLKYFSLAASKREPVR